MKCSLGGFAHRKAPGHGTHVQQPRGVTCAKPPSEHFICTPIAPSCRSKEEHVMHERWIADRMKEIEVSGIRKVFDLAANLKDPVNLSIGQPHFPVPTPPKEIGRASRGAR